MTANFTLQETRKQMFAEFERKLLAQRPPEDGLFYLHPDEEHLVVSHALCHLMTCTAAKQHSRQKPAAPSVSGRDAGSLAHRVARLPQPTPLLQPHVRRSDV